MMLWVCGIGVLVIGVRMVMMWISVCGECDGKKTNAKNRWLQGCIYFTTYVVIAALWVIISILMERIDRRYKSSNRLQMIVGMIVVLVSFLIIDGLFTMAVISYVNLGENMALENQPQEVEVYDMEMSEAKPNNQGIP